MQLLKCSYAELYVVIDLLLCGLHSTECAFVLYIFIYLYLFMQVVHIQHCVECCRTSGFFGNSSAVLIHSLMSGTMSAPCYRFAAISTVISFSIIQQTSGVLLLWFCVLLEFTAAFYRNVLVLLVSILRRSAYMGVCRWCIYTICFYVTDIKECYIYRRVFFIWHVFLLGALEKVYHPSAFIYFGEDGHCPNKVKDYDGVWVSGKQESKFIKAHL